MLISSTSFACWASPPASFPPSLPPSSQLFLPNDEVEKEVEDQAEGEEEEDEDEEKEGEVEPWQVLASVST